MDTIYQVYALLILGPIAIIFLVHQALRTARWVGKQWIRFRRIVLMHLTLPRVFRGRLFFNPSRADLLLHTLHWILAIIYNTLHVTDLQTARVRAAQLAVVHLTFLLASLNLGVVAHTLNLPMRTVVKIHVAFGVMAALQGTAHGCMHLWTGADITRRAFAGIVVRMQVRQVFGWFELTRR